MTDAPVDIRDHAAANLRYIREAMERASSFTIIPGRGIIIIGLTALLAARIAAEQVTPQAWTLVWLVELLVACVVDVAATVIKARSSRVSLGVPFRRFLVSFSAPLFAGGLLTVLFYKLAIHDYLPTLWLLLYGTAIVTGGVFSIRIVPAMGTAFILLGIASLVIAPAGTNLVMASGFGGLHILFGLIIAWRHGG